MGVGSKAALDNRGVNGASWTRKHCVKRCFSFIPRAALNPKLLQRTVEPEPLQRTLIRV
jgi:hypothetical protein